MDNLTKVLESGFTEFRTRFENIDKTLGTVVKRLDTVDSRLSTLERGVSDVKGTLLDVQEEVASINFALENDAKRYFDHERRIGRLEKVRA